MPVDSVENSRGLDNKTVVFVAAPRAVFDVVKFAGKRYDYFWCGVFGFEAASPIRLFSTLMRTVGRAHVTNCTCSERVGLSRMLVCSSLFFRFSDLEWSRVLIGRHGWYSQMRKACSVHDLWTLSFVCCVEGYFKKEVGNWEIFYWNSVIELALVACGTPEASMSSWRV